MFVIHGLANVICRVFNLTSCSTGLPQAAAGKKNVNEINMRYLIITMLILTVGCSEKTVEVRFGTIEIAERVGEYGFRFRFGQETDRVPLLTMQEGGLYGIEYKVGDENSYEIQLTAITPPKVVVNGGDLELVERSDQEVKFVFKTRTIKGSHIEPLLFSKEDPPGIYKLNVSVNGKPYQSIEYQAYTPHVAH